MASEEAPPTYTETSGQAPMPSSGDAEKGEKGAKVPPSYESLFGKAKAMKEESNGNVDFVKKISSMIFGTIGFTIFLGIMLAIPIAMIVIGVKYRDDCPEEKFIPIYLMVLGSFLASRKFTAIVRRTIEKKCKKKCENQEQCEENKKKVSIHRIVDPILDLFMIAWFIAGNVWVYRTKGDISDDPTAVNYCHPTLYWFAFWITTSVYIVIASCCCCCCCVGVLGICFIAKSAKTNTEDVEMAEVDS